MFSSETSWFLVLPRSNLQKYILEKCIFVLSLKNQGRVHLMVNGVLSSFQLRRKSSAVGFVLLYITLWLVKKTSTFLSTNQMQKKSWLFFSLLE